MTKNNIKDEEASSSLNMSKRLYYALYLATSATTSVTTTATADYYKNYENPAAAISAEATSTTTSIFLHVIHLLFY